ncbi:MAG: hypothetical protein E6G92_11115 [Alphaproteobacteria bacterium]|nr:MAG: hypothetical protein E6G92_11115 [Alphaproteobacteria bacterium]
MFREAIAATLLVAATATIAQQPQISAQERARLQRLGAALAACHGNIVRRDAPGRFTSAQIVDRALAGCASREAAIRAALVQHVGAARAAQAMQQQRTHWRQGIAGMVARARAHRS